MAVATSALAGSSFFFSSAALLASAESSIALRCSSVSGTEAGVAVAAVGAAVVSTVDSEHPAPKTEQAASKVVAVIFFTGKANWML
jgi:hypothetical protein